MPAREPAATDLAGHLARALTRLPSGPLLVGYSGGIDSHVLLHALASLPAARARGLAAVHVNHGLHADSAAWARHCTDVAGELNVPLRVCRVTVVAGGDGPEGAARRARWQAFAEAAAVEPVPLLVLAHHADDQAETVLLRLLRGAGPGGLAAMRPLPRRRDGLRVWRPWLVADAAGAGRIGRRDLADYARRHGLRAVDDPANADARFDRNHLRHQVLPLLRQRWPAVDATLVALAERQRDAARLEARSAAQLLAQATTLDPSVLCWPPLRDAARAPRWAALRDWLGRVGPVSVGADRLARIDREVLGAAVDANPRLDLRLGVLRRYRDHLHWLAPGADAPLDYALDWDGRDPLQLPGGAGTLRIVPAPTTPLPLQVASRRGGERLRLAANRPRRDLRLLLQEAGVPPWLRQRWPVIRLDGEAVAFADVVVAAPLVALLATHGAQLRLDDD